MHEELKRYSSIGNRPGILLFCEQVLTKSKLSLDSVKTACSFINGLNINLRCGLLAFEALGLVSVGNGHCVVINPLFTRYSKEDAVVELCKVCFSFLINSGLINIELLKYNDNVELFYIPKRAFSLQSAVFRNLLISLGALISHNDEFRIARDFEAYFGKLVTASKKKMTLEQLKKRLEAQQEQGEAGELFVIEFERNRCPFTSSDSNRIRQISHIDVSAGYDIISFHDEVSLKRRYIEVKTFKGKPHFHWSANEISSAKLRGDDYFVYLVDADKITSQDYTPEMIQNPYVNVLNSPYWVLSPDSFLVEKVQV